MKFRLYKMAGWSDSTIAAEWVRQQEEEEEACAGDGLTVVEADDRLEGFAEGRSERRTPRLAWSPDRLWCASVSLGLRPCAASPRSLVSVSAVRFVRFVFRVCPVLG